MRDILGIDVDDALFDQWRSWYCPGFQMFRTDRLSPAAVEHVWLADLGDVPLEIRDTFGAYDGSWGTITEDAFDALPRTLRSEILATHEPDEVDLFRWPSAADRDKDQALLSYVLAGAAPSRHNEVADDTWAACATVLPEARRLAGTFARGSGPNCFGTVLAAAGEDTELLFVLPGQIEDFLSLRASKVEGAALTQPGVVLLWRKPDGRPDHACVTLGDGWILNKPAQCWWAPRYVWDVTTTVSMESVRGAYEAWQLNAP